MNYHKNITDSEWKAIERYRRTMSTETFGSRSYELARKHFKIICERIREREKSDQMNLVEQVLTK